MILDKTCSTRQIYTHSKISLHYEGCFGDLCSWSQSIFFTSKVHIKLSPITVRRWKTEQDWELHSSFSSIKLMACVHTWGTNHLLSLLQAFQNSANPIYCLTLTLSIFQNNVGSSIRFSFLPNKYTFGSRKCGSLTALCCLQGIKGLLAWAAG